jgi:hypothetical protein
MNALRPKAYLLKGCPFSMRLRIFLTEAGLTNEIDIVPVENGDDNHRKLFAEVEAAGLKPAFPIVTRAPGSFEIDSQTVIERMVREHKIDTGSLALLRFYNEGMLPRFGKMFMELKRLKGPEWNGEL